MNKGNEKQIYGDKLESLMITWLSIQGDTTCDKITIIIHLKILYLQR